MIAELAAASATSNGRLPKAVQQTSTLSQSANISQQNATTAIDDLPAVPSHEPPPATAQLLNAAVHKIPTIDNLPAIPEQEPSAATDDEAWEEVS